MDDMSEIAKVHCECFDDYFLTSLGNKLVKKYYEQYFCEDELFVIARDDNEIVGFCMGYIRPSHARREFERRNRFLLTLKMFGLCVRLDKQAISRCVKRLKSMIEKKHNECNKKMNSKEKTADILSICVVDKYKGSGVARMLVAEYENLLRENGVCQCTLFVKSDNYRAIHFYENCKFTKCSESNGEIKFIKTL